MFFCSFVGKNRIRKPKMNCPSSIAIENGDLYLIYLWKLVIFHSYVSLPKGIIYDGLPKCLFLVLLINRYSLRAASYCAFQTMTDLNWLVVSSPLTNISQLGLLFPIYGKIRNVPNHQPVILWLSQLPPFRPGFSSHPMHHRAVPVAEVTIRMPNMR